MKSLYHEKITSVLFIIMYDYKKKQSNFWSYGNLRDRVISDLS